MPGENGIDTTAEIRSYDEDIKIIFLTSFSEFAVQSYMLNAFYYQFTPICDADFFQLMDNILTQCAREQSDSLLLRCKSGIHRIRPAQLEFCEVPITHGNYNNTKDIFWEYAFAKRQVNE